MSENKEAAPQGGLLHKFRKIAALKPSEWAELLIAAEALFEARLIFARRSAKYLIERLQAPALPPKTSAPEKVANAPDIDDQLRRLEWAISVAARALPWRTDCLIRCIAADKILRRRNLAPDFYLGVTKHEDNSFGAHAWIRCHGISVAGGEGKEFEVLLGPNNS